MVDKTDPICGMQGHIKKHGHYFCSQHCITKYEKQHNIKTTEQKIDGEKTSKTPVIILISVLVAALIISIIYPWFMLPFMGVFLTAVSILKIMDVKGFAQAFMGYDLIAQKSYAYAKTYPFIEFMLGQLFLLQLLVKPAAIITAIIMLVGVISVSRTIGKKKKMKCACLGSLISVPLTTFTLIEDMIMLIMSIMIFLR